MFFFFQFSPQILVRNLVRLLYLFIASVMSTICYKIWQQELTFNEKKPNKCYMVVRLYQTTSNYDLQKGHHGWDNTIVGVTNAIGVYDLNSRHL